VSRVAESSGKISRRQITLPDVRLYRRRLGAVITHACLVWWRSLHARAAPRRGALYLLAGAGVRARELLDSSYLLLKSRTRRKEFDRDRRTAGPAAAGTAGRESRATGREDVARRSGVGFGGGGGAFSALPASSRDYLLPPATRIYLYVIAASQPSEAAGALQLPVMRRGGDLLRPALTSPR